MSAEKKDQPIYMKPQPERIKRSWQLTRRGYVVIAVTLMLLGLSFFDPAIWWALATWMIFVWFMMMVASR